VYVFYIPLVGLAVGSCYAPMIGAVGRRFSERRSLAIAIVLTGVGAGTLVMPLVVRVLLDQMSWRGTFRLLAAVSFVLLVATAVSVPAQKEPKAVSQLGPRTMAGSAPFRRLYLSVVLIAPGFYAPLAFLNDYAVSVGSSASTAALLVAAIGLSSVASRIWFGGLAERVGALRQYEFSHLVFVVGLAVWLLARDSTLVLFVAAGLHGLAWAAWVTAAPLVLAQWFGVDDLGQLVGGFYTGLGLGAFLGPAISGFVIDTAGYRPAIALVVVTSLLSVATLRTVRHLDPVA
jgi:MFS transporter, OFA family, oxalate/formate antiporter